MSDEKGWKVVCYPEHAKPWTHKDFTDVSKERAEQAAAEYVSLGLFAQAERMKVVEG